jgi:hypothetical protein
LPTTSRIFTAGYAILPFAGKAEIAKIESANNGRRISKNVSRFDASCAAEQIHSDK